MNEPGLIPNEASPGNTPHSCRLRKAYSPVSSEYRDGVVKIHRAELAVPDARELRAGVRYSEQRLAELTRDRIGDARVRLSQEMYALQRNSPRARIDNDRQRVDDLARRVVASMMQLIALRHGELTGTVRHLAALNPEATLARGYAIVREKKTGQVVKRVAQVKGGKEIAVRVSDGEFEATTNQ